MRPLRAFLALVLASVLHTSTGLLPSTPRARSAAAVSLGGRILPDADEIKQTAPMTYEEVADAAAFWGCSLEMTSLGPSYRVELRRTAWRRVKAQDGGQGPLYVNTETGEESDVVPEALTLKRKLGMPVTDTDDILIMEDRSLIGYTVGFVQPGGVLHLDTIQIRRFSGYWNKKSALGQREFVPSPGTYGLGMLLGGIAGCFGQEWNCERAELLAIFDTEKQHKTLTRYYRRLGFREVRFVGDSLESFGDRLAWGGVGTLMEVNVDTWLRKWSPLMRQPDCGLL